MDSGDGGGEGGGGEEREADLSPQALSPPLTLALPGEGSSSRTSASAPAKEPPTLPQSEREEGAEGPQVRGDPQGGEGRGGGSHTQGGEEDDREGFFLEREKGDEEAYAGVGEEESLRGERRSHFPAAVSEEEAVSNQSQTKSKCSLLPQRSLSSSSSTAAASSSLHSRTASPKPRPSPSTSPKPRLSRSTSPKPRPSPSTTPKPRPSPSTTPKPSPSPSTSPKPRPSPSTSPKPRPSPSTSPKPRPSPSTSPKPPSFLSASPKHFSCPPSSSALLSETEVQDIRGDQGWISGFPQSFKSQQSALSLALVAPGSSPAGPHSSIANGDGAKAPEPNDSQPEKEVEDERDKDEEKDGVLRNLNQDLCPNSLTSHMTVMHSRNSCKTLKCPKCNWHYKSQHTLQVHVKEKHPETGGQCVCGTSGEKCVCGGALRGVCGYCSSGKPHPRLARGETYACGYKPYRCEVCDYATSSKGNLSIHMQSDKHLNNVQSGGLANAPLGALNGSPNGHATEEQAVYVLAGLPVTPPAAAQPAKPPQQQPPVTQHTTPPSLGKRWRCDVCDYETSIARNLRIHTTSEKHTHNMLRLQRGYYLSQCRSMNPQVKHLQNAGAELSLTMRLTSQQVTDPPVTLGSTLTPSPSPSPSPPPAPSPTGPLSPGVFQCLVCSHFSADSLECVEQHLNAPRSLPQSEWCSLVAGGCHCRLCGYTTPLRANFSLHCQTDRHRTRYQLAAHLQEGGLQGEEAEALIAKGNPIQLRCNLCDYVTSSLEKLQGHSLNSHHEGSVRVYRFLQQYDGEVDGGSWLFHCLLCSHSSSSKPQLLRHSQTPAHQQREGLLQLQPMGGEELAAIFTIRKSPEHVKGELSEDMEPSTETTGPLDQTKDTCNWGVEKISKETDGITAEEIRDLCPPAKRPSSEQTDVPLSPKRPRTHQHTKNQQTVQCPLCQVLLADSHLREHLTHLHSVAQDCVDRLMSTVTPPVEQPEPKQETEQQPAETDRSTDDDRKDHRRRITDDSHAPECPTAHTQKDNGMPVEKADGDEATPKDVPALLTPPLEDGRQAPQSPTQLPPPSSPPTSPPPGDPPLPSDRHGYRFRCSRCSLAFPTQEKLQLHWQYHAMRAATECPLCSRRCRSQEALQRHMQNTHSQLDATTHPQCTLLTPHSTTLPGQSSVQQEADLSPQAGQEAGEGDDEEMEEEALEIEAKEEPRVEEKNEGNSMEGEIEGGEEVLVETERGHREESGSEPSPSLSVRKGSNPTMDRYLDPARPYKCTVCSESFTQKTILLVHYNSVSHLHRARRARQDSGPALPEAPRGPDPRPYRCRLCGVGYTQSSTLDIHLRSVLHQTRARAAQNLAPPQTPASVSTTTQHAQAATSREESSKGLSLARKPELVALSTSSLAGSASDPQLTLPGPNESQQAKMRELLASRSQLMLIQQQQLAQAQAQAQAQFQQHTALLQSQLFNPALLQHLPLGPDSLLNQHFSLLPDNLLSLQQQLLLPFYLSGDMTLHSDLTLRLSDFSQAGLANHVPHTEQLKEEVMGEPLPEAEEEPTQKQTPNSAAYTQACEPVQCKTKAEVGYSDSSVNQVQKGHSASSPEGEKRENAEKQREPSSDGNGNSNVSSLSHFGPECPPPRVPYAAVNGEPLRALLQGYGYELALQYIQNRQRNQLKILALAATPEERRDPGIKEEDGYSEEKDEFKRGELQNGKTEERGEESPEGVHHGEAVDEETEGLPREEKKESKREEVANRVKRCCGEGEKCGDCGKLFSDALVLKSHQEYFHRLLFPTAVLERFSKEYRVQYDKVYPLPTAGETSVHPAPAPDPAPDPAPATAPGPEPPTETVKIPVKAPPSSPSPPVSQPTLADATPVSDLKPTSPACSPPTFSPQPPVCQQQEEATPSSSSPSSSSAFQPPSQATPLPKLPMLPLTRPQLPQLPLPPLPLPPMPFPMDLPLLPSVVMQSMALQSQPWLDCVSGMTSDLTKLYQSQLSPALLGQPLQLTPSLLAQASQTSPVLLGHQQPQASPVLPDPQQGKRARTRLSEKQLAVLRQHFDINSLPSDEDMNKMSALAGLPHKVIKHWFRNTLFKERQRDKDSPYNFNNPPTTALADPPFSLSPGLPPNHSLADPPSSLSPGIPPNRSPQPQRQEPHRGGEPHSGRRCSRTRFTEQQLETLQGVFEATPYPREEEYDRLSARLSLPNRIIVVWFQNARQRARKHQDRGTEEGLEGKSHVDSVQRAGCYKNSDHSEDENCNDEGQGGSQNENSMDLTYEYYTHPDSPTPLDSQPRPTDYGEHTPVIGEPNSVSAKSEDDDATSSPVEKSQGLVSEVDGQSQETAKVLQSLPSQPETQQLQPLIPPQKPFITPLPAAQSSPGDLHSHRSASPPDNPAHTSINLHPESETSHPRLHDATLGPPSVESQPQNQLQAQFQCSLCPVSLPSFQLWQEHQTRHLLAAQSQVQLLHPGFTDRPMPYMMLHPNHTLMASQLLSGAMTQLHPNHTHAMLPPHMNNAHLNNSLSNHTHAMLPHMNNTHLKNSLSNHTGNALAGLPQASMSSMKQGSKVTSEVGYDVPGGGREAAEEEQRRDKRQRTTITPEQLEVLCQRYSLDSNPTRGVLEGIARDVGLKRRVVQVWFQNTRARERKGQFRSMGPGFTLGLSHLRCPFCRALFKVKSALDAHMRSRHWAEAERVGFSLSPGGGGSSSGHMGNMASFLERPGSSLSLLTVPSHGFLAGNNKGFPEKPPLTADSSAFDLNHPEGEEEEEEEEYEEGEEEEEGYPCEEGSSVTLSPEGSGGPSSEWGEAQRQQHQQHQQLQQQRQRTQMSHFQVLQLRAVYRSHRTPNRQECEALGQELGLPHRVVQVWFQNARAKEKRARSLSSDSAEREQAELSAGAGERDRA